MESIVITGVSTGIGYATTKVLIAKGYRIFGSVRNQNDAKKLKEDFGKKFIPLLFDVTDEKAIINASEQVGEILGENETILGLVNNAGIGLGGPLLELPTAVFRKQFEVNVLGVVSVTRAFSKLLGCNNKSQSKD